MPDKPQSQNTALQQNNSPANTPSPEKRMPAWIKYSLGLVGLVYILNPTSGIFELLPDVMPYVGNLDEGAAAVLLWTGLQEFLAQRRIRKQASKMKSS